MADTRKSIQVNIDVVVNQAKKAMSDMASTTQKTAESFDKMGVSAKKANDEISKTTGATAKASGGFLDMAKGVFTGMAAYDLFKKSVGVAVDFLRSSINESIDAAATMARVKTNVENAGFAFAEIGPQIDAYSKKMVEMGFDDEATALSVSRLMGITHNYSQSLKLNKLAMDLSRNANIDLATATSTVSQILGGSGSKALIQYGIYLKDGGSAVELLTELQEKLKGQTEEFAGTVAGKLLTVNEKWANMKQEVGDKLSPVLSVLIDKFTDNMPAIIGMVTKLAEGFASVVGWMAKISGNELLKFSNNVTAASDSLTKYAVALAEARKGQGDLTVEQARNALTAATTGLNVTKLTDQQKILNDALKDGQVSLGEFNSLQAIGVDVGKWKIFGNNLKTVKGALGSVNTELEKNKESFENNKGAIELADKTLGVLGSTTTEVVEGFVGIGVAGKDATQTIDAQGQKVKDLGAAFNEVKNKQTEFTFKSAEDFDKFGKLISDTKMNQEQWITSTKQGFTAYSAAIKEVESDMESLNKKILDAQKSLSEFTTSTTKSGGQQFAQIVFDAEKSIPKLQQQISEGQADGQDTTELQKQLDDALAVITESQKAQYNSQNDSQNASYQLSVEYHTALDLLRKQDGQNALQNAYEVMQQKIADKIAETKVVIEEAQKQILADQEQKDKYLLAQTAMTIAYGQAVKLRQKSQTSEIASLESLTASVNAARDAYIAMAAAARAAGRSTGGTTGGGGSNTGHAAGGLVNPGQTYMVGEQGPELFTSKTSGQIVPNDKVSAMSAPNNINITINNPSIRSEQDIHSLAQEISRILGRQQELARFGSLK